MMVPDTSDGVSEGYRALMAGDRLTIDDGAPVEVGEVKQRNWSRVGVARRGAEQFFIKQFVDRIGRWHQRGFAGDAETIALLGDEIAGVVVLPIIHRDETQLLTASRFVNMATIDSLRGRKHERDRQVSSLVGTALAAIIEERAVPGHPENVAVWKGLDPKNLGRSDDGTLYIFDFGPPTTISRHDAAAAAVAAGLLSRWVARPGLHLVAPERDILRNVCEPLVSMTTLEAVQESLDRHRVLRLREPQRDGAAGIATRLGVRTLGSIYWRAAEREAARLFRAG